MQSSIISMVSIARIRIASGFLFLCCIPIAPSVQPLSCSSYKQLFATYEDLSSTLDHFKTVHQDFERARPKVVSDHVKAFRIYALSQGFLNVVEAFRLVACVALCRDACLEPRNEDANLARQLQLVEKLNDLQLDVELLVEDHIDFRGVAQQILREAKQYAATLVQTVLHSGGVNVDWNEGIAICVSNVVPRLMFPLFKIISLASKQNESHIILHGVTLDRDEPASTSASYISPAPPIWGSSGELSYGILNSLATGAGGLRLLSGPSNSAQGICSVSASPHLLGHLSWPRRWRQPLKNADEVPHVVQMLEQIEESVVDLSHSYMVLRPVGDVGFADNISCAGKGIFYDPTSCLDSRGWGGYVYNVNVHPPFKAELRVVGQSLGDDAQTGDSRYMNILRPYPGVEAGDTLSIEHLFYRIDFIWRQTNEPSPDIFFLHPSVHNCHAVEYLFTGAPLKPKILVIPVNPLIPPPIEVMPRFDAWWHILRPSVAMTRMGRSWVSHGEQDDGLDVLDWGDMDEYFMPSMWFGQCSLSAVTAMLKRMAKKRFKYELHHLDQGFAVYVRKDLQETLRVGGSDASPFSTWLEGWFCKPDSRFFSRLEAVAGAEMMLLADESVPHKEKEAILCRFFHDHRIPVQKRNFDCAGVVGSRSVDLETAGTHSCMRPDLRGWGNDAAVYDSQQDSAGSCELHCVRQNCSYWTYDPTSMYGQPLCWVWIGGRPAEIKPEQAWISGDVDCHLEQSAATSSAIDVVSLAISEPNTIDHGTEFDAIPAGRERFKQWAILQSKEIPGMRFFIEGGRRGRCLHDFCECFPPFRGPLCEQTEPGMFDGERNFTAVLHYLTSDEEQDVEDLTQSLPRLWRNFNRRFDYPVVLFNDGMSEEHRQRIVQASDNRVWFAFVDDYLAVPDMIMKDPSRHAMLQEVKWSLGYRGMCRFRSGTIFLQPVLQNFQYAMTLDTDGYFPAEVAYDPIAAMHAGGYTYTWSHLLPDLPGAVRHFWEHSLMYMRMKEIDPRGTEILRQFIREEDVQWNYQLYMNDIEIVQLDWFRSDPYQDYFRFLDSMGGFWLYRWGDHAVRTIAVGMWLPQEKVYEMDIPYGHQNYCRCSSAHPEMECIREGDAGGEPRSWWVCAPKKGGS